MVPPFLLGYGSGGIGRTRFRGVVLGGSRTVGRRDLLVRKEVRRSDEGWRLV